MKCKICGNDKDLMIQFSKYQICGKCTRKAHRERMGRPEYGKQYSLTGGHGQPCIFNGNTWAESEVK